MCTKRAFTLVELLVVIAIISVLAALLLPALESAIQAARSTQCASNEKNLFLSWQCYMDDYNGSLPKWNSYLHAPTPPLLFWTEYMHPYLESAVSYNSSLPEDWQYQIMVTGILHCPVEAWDNDSKHCKQPDYGMNQWGIGGGDPHVTTKPYHRVSDVKYPSRQIAFGDSTPALAGSMIIDPRYYNAFRHDARSNILYCDGHIEAHTQLILEFMDWWGKAPWGNPR